MTGEAVNAASMAFKKSLIERAPLGPSLASAFAARTGGEPRGREHQGNGTSGKTVLS